MTHAIVWRRIDKPGHEYCRLQEIEGGARLTGVAILTNDATPHCVEYEIHCDTGWRTLRCRLAENSASTRTDWEIRREGNLWMMNGVEVPAVAGCEDIDLGFSPATNLLPIRRLSLKPGETAVVNAAAAIPEFTLELLAQTPRGSARTYHMAQVAVPARPQSRRERVRAGLSRDLASRVTNVGPLPPTRNP